MYSKDTGTTWRTSTAVEMKLQRKKECRGSQSPKVHSICSCSQVGQARFCHVYRMMWLTGRWQAHVHCVDARLSFFTFPLLSIETTATTSLNSTGSTNYKVHVFFVFGPSSILFTTHNGATPRGNVSYLLTKEKKNDHNSYRSHDTNLCTSSG